MVWAIAECQDPYRGRAVWWTGLKQLIDRQLQGGVPLHEALVVAMGVIILARAKRRGHTLARLPHGLGPHFFIARFEDDEYTISSWALRWE